MSLSAAIVTKFESPTRTLLTARPSSSKFPAVFFDRVGKSGQGIRMAAPTNIPITGPADAAPIGYTHQKVVLKLTVSQSCHYKANFITQRSMHSGLDIPPSVRLSSVLARFLACT
jgi:hypothetical protein